MNRIKEVLEEKGIKQIWLAEQLGKSYNMVNSYVQNRRQPNIECLYEIAEILNISVKELLVVIDQESRFCRICKSKLYFLTSTCKLGGQ